MINITPKEHEAICKIVEYLERDERKHYQECNKEDRKGHIYESIKVLKRLVGLK